MIELVVRPVADAFMQVGVFVALMLGVFGYIQYRTGDRVTRFLAERWRSAPFFGALLGVTPGCGGAILVMPLFLRGTVSFGTVIAALVATMGDASFVLLAADPGTGLVLHGILLGTGIVTGYLTDALRIEPRLRPSPAADPPGRGGIRPIGSVGAAEAFPPRPAAVAGAASAAAVRLDATAQLFWWLTAAGFVVAVPVVFGLTDGGELARYLSGVDPYLVTGVAGTLVAVAVFARSGFSLGDDTVESIEGKCHGLADMLRHGARETAFVTVWVTVAYLATTWIIALGGFDLAAAVAISGVAGVLLGAAIGLVPGCAVQVLLTGLYATGMVPFATLVANALSQDGDALFPLVMMDRRSALIATGLTTVPGVLVGTGVLLLG